MVLEFEPGSLAPDALFLITLLGCLSSQQINVVPKEYM